MTPDCKALLTRAHDNGGTARVQRTRDVPIMIEAVECGWLVAAYDQATVPPTYLHHRLTPAGRAALQEAK